MTVITVTISSREGDAGGVWNDGQVEARQTINININIILFLPVGWPDEILQGLSV